MLHAPRILNDPVRCKGSALIKNLLSNFSFNFSDSITGVFITKLVITSAAFLMSFIFGGVKIEKLLSSFGVCFY